MAWLAVDKDGTECVCSTEPYRDWVDFMWCIENIFDSCAIGLPKAQLKNSSVESLLGKMSLWNLKVNNYV